MCAADDGCLMKNRSKSWTRCVRERAQKLGLGLDDTTLRAITQEIKRLADVKTLSLSEVDDLLMEAAAKV